MSTKASKQHYVMIALALFRSKPPSDEMFTFAGVQWRRTVREVAETFILDNKEFDAATFLRVCSEGE